MCMLMTSQSYTQICYLPKKLKANILVRYRSRTLIQSVGEVLIPFLGSSPHGMMNARALETGPEFHSACGTFHRHKYSRVRVSMTILPSDHMLHWGIPHCVLNIIFGVNNFIIWPNIHSWGMIRLLSLTANAGFIGSQLDKFRCTIQNEWYRYRPL